MKRIAATQLRLLTWAKTKKKGFTIDDAMARFKGPRQSVAVRLHDARSRGWLARKKEAGNGGGPRNRFLITKLGTKVAQQKWIGRGRFLELA